MEERVRRREKISSNREEKDRPRKPVRHNTLEFVFHNKMTRKCVIHPVKPETRVAGPITFDVNVKTGKNEWFIKMSRICQLAGAVYMDKQLLRKHLESAKREVLRLVAQLTAEELKANTEEGIA